MPLRVVIWGLGLLLRLLFRVTTSMSLGLLLGLLFRFLDGSPEIGKNVANVNKCRFSLFSDRKNDTRLCDIPYYNKINPLIYSVFTSLLQVNSFKSVCVRLIVPVGSAAVYSKRTSPRTRATPLN